MHLNRVFDSLSSGAIFSSNGAKLKKLCWFYGTPPVFALNSCFRSISTFAKTSRKLKYVLNARPNEEICPGKFLESNFEIHVDVQ